MTGPARRDGRAHFASRTVPRPDDWSRPVPRPDVGGRLLLAVDRERPLVLPHLDLGDRHAPAVAARRAGGPSRRRRSAPAARRWCSPRRTAAPRSRSGGRSARPPRPPAAAGRRSRSPCRSGSARSRATWTRTRQLCPCSRSHLPPWKRIWCAALKTKSFEISKTGRPCAAQYSRGRPACTPGGHAPGDGRAGRRNLPRWKGSHAP